VGQRLDRRVRPRELGVRDVSEQRVTSVALQALAGQTVVVKYGGHAMVGPELAEAFAREIVALSEAGVRVVVVHGGGAQITAMLDRLGIHSEFRAGLRVTSPEAMRVVRMVLTGDVQREVVAALNSFGSRAVGLTGDDAGTFLCEPATVEVDGSQVSLGLVGEVVEVNCDLINLLLDRGFTPVVSSIAMGRDRLPYNVNADTAAAALAVALEATQLVVLTDVAGLYANWPDPESLVDRITTDDLRPLVPSLDAGMRPKMEAALRSVDGGVQRATVVDGRVAGAVTAALLGQHSGTAVTSGEGGS